MAGKESVVTARKRKLLKAIWMLALIGLAVSIELTRIYYAVYRDVDYVPACNFTEQVNCAAVALSNYSAVLLNIPNSVYGIAVYFAIMALIPFRLHTRLRPFKHLENYLAMIAVFSFAFTVYLAAVSSFVLKTLCPWCTALYALNTALVVLGVLSLDRPGQMREQLKDDFNLVKTDPRYLGVFLGVVILGLVAGIVQFNRMDRQSVKPRMDRGQTRVEIDVSNDPVLGPAHAPVTIIEFSDFQCPYCREMHEVLKDMREEFGPRLRVVYKNFPLDSDCNPRVKTTLHPGSCLLAYAAECAYQSGCFESFYDKLINADSFSPGSLLQMAIDCGMDPDVFQACMAGESPKEAVRADINDALKIGIKGTPMLVVNSHIIQGSRSEKEMEAIIKAALEGKTIPKY